MEIRQLYLITRWSAALPCSVVLDAFCVMNSLNEFILQYVCSPADTQCTRECKSV